MLESPNQRRIWAAAAMLAGAVLFRVNTGMAWVGRGRRMPNGDVHIVGGRPVALGFGLMSGKPAVGVSDLVGWRSVVITADMVGCRVAVFAAIEAKRDDGKGVVSTDQRRWRDTVIAAGGIAGVAISEDEAIAIFNAWRPVRPAGAMQESSTP